MKKLVFIKVLLIAVFTIAILNKLLLDNYSYGFFTARKINIVEEVSVSRDWVVNSNIVQYSSYLIKLEKSMFVEAFILLSKDFESAQVDHKQFLRCFYSDDQEINTSEVTDVTRISFMAVKGFGKKLWRVRCGFKGGLHYDAANVAVVDSREFANDKAPVEYIQYQRVIAVEATRPRKQAVAHCVHMLRGVDNERKQRLFNWLDIQKQIGVHQISFYVYDTSNQLLREIQQKYNETFVRIVLHPTKFDDVCRQQTQKYVENPGHAIYKKLYNVCKQAHQYHFEMTDDLVANTHERINTNDCLFSYKYEYKYVSTYDIDEIIFPRSFKLDYNFDEANCHKDCFRNLQFNIFNYAEKLFNRFNSPSCVHFENVMFLPFNSHLMNFTNKIFSMNISVGSEVNLLRDIGSKDHVSYKLNAGYLNKIKNKVELGRCLSENSLASKDPGLDLTWRRVFATLMNMRNGKSIFDTNKTEGINQHFSDVPYTECAKVPINDGYCGHFRESLATFFIKQVYPIDYFVIDIEYYYFIKNHIFAHFSNLNKL